MIGSLLNAIAALAIKAVNALIEGVAAVLVTLLEFLPEMPDLPDRPDAVLTAQEWVSWAFPVGTLVDCLIFTLTMWLLWQAVAIALRWAKATDA